MSVFPSTKRLMRRQALSMSNNGLRASGSIERHPRGGNGSAEIWILDGVFLDQVDLSIEQGFQRVEQAEVRIRVVGWWHRFKRDEKVDVAGRGLKRATRRRTEHIEPRDMIASA